MKCRLQKGSHVLTFSPAPLVRTLGLRHFSCYEPMESLQNICSPKTSTTRLFVQDIVRANIKEIIKPPHYWPFVSRIPRSTDGRCIPLATSIPSHKTSNAECVLCHDVTYCPASRTTLVATRFRVAVICPIIQVPHCIRVFFYFVWFVFINHIFQFIMNYVPIVTFWIFTYHKIWILSIMFCSIWSYWIIYFLAC